MGAARLGSVGREMEGMGGGCQRGKALADEELKMKEGMERSKAPTADGDSPRRRRRAGGAAGI